MHRPIKIEKHYPTDERFGMYVCIGKIQCIIESAPKTLKPNFSGLQLAENQ